MVVGAAGHYPEPLGGKGTRKGLGVAHYLSRVQGEARLRSLVEGDRFGCDDVLEGAPLQAREHGLVDALGEPLLRNDATAAWPPQRLVRSEGDDVRERDGVGVGAASDQPRNMRRVEK